MIIRARIPSRTQPNRTRQIEIRALNQLTPSRTLSLTLRLQRPLAPTPHTRQLLARIRGGRAPLREAPTVQRIPTIFAEHKLVLLHAEHGLVADRAVVVFAWDLPIILLARTGFGGGWHLSCCAGVGFLNAAVGNGVRRRGGVGEDTLQL